MSMRSAPPNHGPGPDNVAGRDTTDMKPFIPKRLEGLTFGFLVSGMMSFMVSGIATAMTVGIAPGFIGLWMGAWLPSWAMAFPAILVVAPLVRRILARIVIAR